MCKNVSIMFIKRIFKKLYFKKYSLFTKQIQIIDRILTASLALVFRFSGGSYGINFLGFSIPQRKRKNILVCRKTQIFVVYNIKIIVL